MKAFVVFIYLLVLVPVISGIFTMLNEASNEANFMGFILLFIVLLASVKLRFGAEIYSAGISAVEAIKQLFTKNIK